LVKLLPTAVIVPRKAAVVAEMSAVKLVKVVYVIN